MGCWYDNDSVFKLFCENSQRIYIESATYGASADECQEENRCCPSPADYRVDLNTNKIQQLMYKCDRKLNCEISVDGVSNYRTYTDYETVMYICSTKSPGKQKYPFSDVLINTPTNHVFWLLIVCSSVYYFGTFPESMC